jgi:DNA-binding transcriptional MerR regulator
MPKSKDAFRTISEVAEWLDVQPHVLRFWESKFSQVRPVKRAGGRRYYRPSDMLLIGGIKQLLHDDGMTIKGVQKLLREKGVKEISKLSRAIDDDSHDMEAISDPDPVTEADLMGEAAPVTSATVIAKEDATEDDDAAEDTLEQASIAEPKNPLSQDAPGWEIRRKVLARLTEISAVDPAKRDQIAALARQLAAQQAKALRAANP